MTLATSPGIESRYFIHPARPEETARLQDELGISPVLARLLVNRGIADSDAAQAFLFGGYEDLLDPERLDGIAAAADLVAAAAGAGERIVVHGDYDADGVSATALLTTFLRDVGATVEAYIPHRIDEGYGLSRDGVVWASEQGCRLLVSVDCGSSSPQEVALARSLGIRTVITDHHMLGAVAPDADVLVNPRRPGSTYPFPHLSGVGVAFKLVQAVARRLGRGEPRAYLDFTAIGTVGDVVPLLGENRILVREGLLLMGGGARPGLAALARVANLGSGPDGTLSARDVAFHIAPRINACGRLEHARTAARLLMESDAEQALALAQEIDALNQRRRDMEAAQREAAEARVLAAGPEPPAAIVEASPDWHPGLVGITANRLLDRFGAPAFVISVDPNGLARGSARGPAHLDLFACLTACGDLFEHFGGHPRAGGFTIREERIPILKERLQEVVARQGTAPHPALTVDMELPLPVADVDLAEELQELAPFGQANPEPLFLARHLQIQAPSRVKEKHLRFVAAQGNTQAHCIAFGMGERAGALRDGEVYDVLFHLEVDEFRSERRPSLKVREILTRDGSPVGSAPAMPTSPEVRAPAPCAPRGGAGWEFVDAREVANRGRCLADLVHGGKRTLALVRRSLLAFASRVVSGHEDAPPANFQAVAYGTDPACIPAAEDYVLFSPPPSVDALCAVLSLGGLRCHVLFGARELEEEERVVRAVHLDRPRMEAIYRFLRSDPERPCGPAELEAAAQRLEPEGIGRDAVRVAFRVLVEMGVAREANGCYRWTRERADLESSPTWRQYSSLLASFQEIRRIFALEGGTLTGRLQELAAAARPGGTFPEEEARGHQHHP